MYYTIPSFDWSFLFLFLPSLAKGGDGVYATFPSLVSCFLSMTLTIAYATFPLQPAWLLFYTLECRICQATYMACRKCGHAHDQVRYSPTTPLFSSLLPSFSFFNLWAVFCSAMDRRNGGFVAYGMWLCGLPQGLGLKGFVSCPPSLPPPTRQDDDNG